MKKALLAVQSVNVPIAIIVTVLTRTTALMMIATTVGNQTHTRTKKHKTPYKIQDTKQDPQEDPIVFQCPRAAVAVRAMWGVCTPFDPEWCPT